ncbi:MAG: Hsp20/alpha crystallin family protein [Actinomycetota bacterium]|nr:Hsp20/alpha crystallin family protein [Actinomycetota bacterium]
MLMRTDPFRELDRLTDAVFGTAARPAVMPMDAYRSGDAFYVHFDLPGIDLDSIDLTVERNVLTVRAQRKAARTDEAERIVSERPQGVFTRQLFLGETLDVDNLRAEYDAGVLTLTIPVAEQAKPRKVEISGSSQPKEINAA